MTECVNCAKFKGCDLSSPNVNECADYKETLTNENYLRSCTTEQLAEWIAHQSIIVLLENQNNHSLRMTYPAYWVEWLKQPHTVKE